MSVTTLHSEKVEDAVKPREMLQMSFNHPVPFQAGSAEPWIAELVAALLVANGSKTACEIGGFQGATSTIMAEALSRLPWSTQLTVCEIDPVRASDVDAALEEFRGAELDARVVLADSHVWIPTLPDASLDFCWLDGNHEIPHVARELDLLHTKMRPGGIIAGHDVFGVCNLRIVFEARGGYALDLPKLGPAGGIGILQKPR